MSRFQRAQWFPVVIVLILALPGCSAPREALTEPTNSIQSTFEYPTTDLAHVLGAFTTALDERRIAYQRVTESRLHIERDRAGLPETVEIWAMVRGDVTHVTIRQQYYRMGRDFLHFPFHLPILARTHLAESIGRSRRVDPPQAIFPAGADSCFSDSWPAVEGSDQPPEMIGGMGTFQQRLNFPEDAYRAGVEGIVYAAAIVDAEGRVICAEITHGLPGGINLEVLDALRRTDFEPATRDGEPVGSRITIPITFRHP